MKRSIKHIIALLLAALTVLSLAACGGKNADQTSSEKTETAVVTEALDKPVGTIRMNGHKATMPGTGEPFFAKEVDEELGVNDVMMPIEFWNLNHGNFFKTLSASVDGDGITFMTQYDKITMHVGDTKATYLASDDGSVPEEFTCTAPCRIGNVVYAPLISTWYKMISGTRYYYSEALGTVDLTDGFLFPISTSATKDLKHIPLSIPSQMWENMTYEASVASGMYTEDKLEELFGYRAKNPEAYFTGAPEETLFNNNAYLSESFHRGNYTFAFSGETLENIGYDEFAEKLVEETDWLLCYNAGSIQTGFTSESAFLYMPPIPDFAGIVTLRGWMWSRRVNPDTPLNNDDQMIMRITGVTDEEYRKDFAESQADDPVNSPEYNEYCNRQSICHARPVEISYAVAARSDGSGFDVTPMVSADTLESIAIGEDHVLTDYMGYTDGSMQIFPEYWEKHPEAATPAAG